MYLDNLKMEQKPDPIYDIMDLIGKIKTGEENKTLYVNIKQ